MTNKSILIACSILGLSTFLYSFQFSKQEPFNNLLPNDVDTIKGPSFNTNLEAYFGGCGNIAGTMPKEKFIALMNNDLCAKDIKTNTILPIVSFDFTYCERALTEDSLGIEMLTTDISFEEFSGASIPKNWKGILIEKLYKGDTIKFTNIKVRTAKGKERTKTSIVIPISQ